MKYVIVACALLPLPLLAQDYPPVDYYIGQYRMIGLDDAGPVDRMLRMDADGDALTLTLCGATGTMVLQSDTDPTRDEHFTAAVIDGLSLTCEPFNTYDNYALIVCYGDGDSNARLTLWPATEKFNAPLTCVD